MITQRIKGYPYDDQWVPAGETELSLIISIVDYWL